MVRTNQKIVLRLGIVLGVFVQVIDRRARTSIVVSGSLQNWNVDARELLFIWNHLLPVCVVTGMGDPLIEDRVGCAVDLLQITIGSAADVPIVVQFVPALILAIG